MFFSQRNFNKLIRLVLVLFLHICLFLCVRPIYEKVFFNSQQLLQFVHWCLLNIPNPFDLHFHQELDVLSHKLDPTSPEHAAHNRLKNRNMIIAERIMFITTSGIVWPKKMEIFHNIAIALENNFFFIKIIKKIWKLQWLGKVVDSQDFPTSKSIKHIGWLWDLT